MKNNSLSTFYDADKDKIENILSKKNNQYKTFSIPKKSGGKRIINQPLGELFTIQKEISLLLLINKLDIVDVSHAFESKKSIVTNALKHVNKKIVLNIDFKDFFTNITKADIFNALILIYNISEDNLNKICELLTYNNSLPTGSPSSPVLSNYVCNNIDIELNRYCEENKFNTIEYTRYADDLTFSFTEKSNLQYHLIRILSVIQENNFIINHKKVRFFYSNKRQVVTGLVVNEKVNVSRNFYKNLRAILYNWQNMGYEITSKSFYSKYPNRKDFITTISGWVNFYGQVKGKNDSKYTEFREMFNLLYLDFNLHFNGKLNDITLKQFKDIIKTEKFKFYTDQYNSDLFVHINSKNKFVVKILKADVEILKVEPNKEIAVTYSESINYRKYQINTKRKIEENSICEI